MKQLSQFYNNLDNLNLNDTILSFFQYNTFSNSLLVFDIVSSTGNYPKKPSLNLSDVNCIKYSF